MNMNTHCIQVCTQHKQLPRLQIDFRPNTPMYSTSTHIVTLHAGTYIQVHIHMYMACMYMYNSHMYMYLVLLLSARTCAHDILQQLIVTDGEGEVVHIALPLSNIALRATAFLCRYVYIYMYMYMKVYMCTYTHAQYIQYMYREWCTCRYTYMQVQRRMLCTFSNTCTCIFVYLHVYLTDVHMHSCTHTCTCTCTHMYIPYYSPQNLIGQMMRHETPPHSQSER